MVRTACNRLSWFLVVLGTAMLSRGARGAGEDAVPSGTDSGIAVELALPQTVFRGLPCLATVTVTARSSGPTRPPTRAVGVPVDRAREAFTKYLLAYPGFPAYDFLRGYPPVSVEIVDIQSGHVEMSIRPARLAFDTLDPRVVHLGATPLQEVKLPAAEIRSYAVDAGGWFEDVRDGNYSVVVGLHNRYESKIAESRPISTRFASLSDEVVVAIRRSIPNFPPRISPLQPRDWLALRMNWRVLRDTLPKEVFSQLALYCFLSDVAHEGKIEKASAELLDSVPGHLEDFAAALRYEVLLAKGEKEAAKKLRDAVLSKSTGMKWRFDEADAGNGLLQQVIKRISPTLRAK